MHGTSRNRRQHGNTATTGGNKATSRARNLRENAPAHPKSAAPQRPRYARVPSGAETCRFCIMLASRGAVYLSKDNAGAVSHYHANCDCKVVPDWGDDIEGYDPDEYYKLWKNGVLKTEESIRKTINHKWAEFQKTGTEDAYFSTVGKYIRSFSEDGLIDCEFRAKPKAKELMTAKSLSKNGHQVIFLRETGEGKNPDAILDGEICDFKRIESGNPNKIFQNVKRSEKQAELYVIDLRISKIDAENARRVSGQTVDSAETYAKKLLILFADENEDLIKK